LQVEWLTSLGDTCQTSCDFQVTIDPPLTETIDTLIVLGESVEINGETYNEGGQYIQELTNSEGCDSILTINVIILNTVIHYDLNACESFMSNNTHMDYSEFFPSYPQPLPCASIVGDTLHRENPQVNKHSCTPGVSDSPGMCVGALPGCTYLPGDEASVVIELQVTPDPDTAVYLTGFSFYEKAPLTYEWISGNSGPNNYPTLFNVRVLKNGTEIYVSPATATAFAWHEVVFDFFGIDEFLVTEPTTFRFELLSYCPIGNGATESVWDLDEINFVASCASVNLLDKSISGVVATSGDLKLRGIEMKLYDDPSLTNEVVTNTVAGGFYRFEGLEPKNDYYIRGFKDTDHTDGVNTLDLIQIQKHLLGIKRFASPYQMIAADVNRSNSITAIDLVIIRKLLLGKYSSFPNNTSWRFGVASQHLEISAPWFFDETLGFEYLASDITDADFIGVKTGDVTGDAKNDLAAILPRWSETLLLNMADENLVAGVPTKIDITSSDFSNIAGLQLGLEMPDGMILDVEAGTLAIGEENFNITSDGRLLMSWNAENLASATADEVLFSVIVMSSANGTVADMVKLSNQTLLAEAYAGESLDRLQIELEPTTTQPSTFENALFVNEPNPFSENTTVRFSLEQSGDASLRFYDLSGRLLHDISATYSQGMNTVVIAQDKLGISHGIVICQLQAAGFTATQKMVVVRE
ncbi:MAG TPA: dockerin type I domain-containing protein, partial [Saprospiraceae bacterium]|nr:dockerin type I domain-containing protein [Saprospiraceae bacterium]